MTSTFGASTDKNKIPGFPSRGFMQNLGQRMRLFKLSKLRFFEMLANPTSLKFEHGPPPPKKKKKLANGDATHQSSISNFTSTGRVDPLP